MNSPNQVSCPFVEMRSLTCEISLCWVLATAAAIFSLVATNFLIGLGRERVDFLV